MATRVWVQTRLRVQDVLALFAVIQPEARVCLPNESEKVTYTAQVWDHNGLRIQLGEAADLARHDAYRYELRPTSFMESAAYLWDGHWPQTSGRLFVLGTPILSASQSNFYPLFRKEGGKVELVLAPGSEKLLPSDAVLLRFRQKNHP